MTNNKDFDYSGICDIIKNNIKGRELVLRWKSPDLERALFEKLGIKPAFYVTRVKERCDDKETFLDTVILEEGKSDKYYLVIAEGLAWNNADAKRYNDGGYTEIKDMLWIFPKPKIVNLDKDSTYSDEYGNTIHAETNCSFELNGKNIRVRIGKNVKLPNAPIKLYHDTVLEIGDGASLVNAEIKLVAYTTLILNSNVGLGTMNVFVNSFSTVEIGARTTFQSGKLRTGRNQLVTVGKDCMFSWDIIFLPHDGHLIWDLKEKRFINNTSGEQRHSVAIGDHVWIGGETVFMPNSSVGSGSICGYRSLVRNKFPNNCVLAGSPARVVRKDVAWLKSNFSNNDNDILALPENYRLFTEE